MSEFKKKPFKRRTFANAHEKSVLQQDFIGVDEEVERGRNKQSADDYVQNTYDPQVHGDMEEYINNSDHGLILKKRDESYFAKGRFRKVDDVCKTAHHATMVASFYLMCKGVSKNVDLDDFITGASMLFSMNNAAPELAYEEVHAAVSYLDGEKDFSCVEQMITCKQMLTEKTSVRTNASLMDYGVGLIPYSEEDSSKTAIICDKTLTQDFNDSIRVPMLTVEAETKFEQINESVHSFFGISPTDTSVETIQRLIRKNKLPKTHGHRRLLDQAGVFFPEPVPSSKYGQCSIAAVAVDKYFKKGIDVLYVRDFVFSRVGDVVQHHEFGYEKVVPLPAKTADGSLALLSTVTDYSEVLKEMKDMEENVAEMSQEEKLQATAKTRIHMMHESSYELIRQTPIGESPMNLKYATLASPKPLGDKDALALSRDGKLDLCVFMMRSQDYCRAMTNGLECPMAVILDAPSLLLLVFHSSLGGHITADYITPVGTLVSMTEWFLGVPSMAYSRPAWFDTLTYYCLARFVGVLCGDEFYSLVRDKHTSETLVKNKRGLANKLVGIMEAVHPHISPFSTYRVYVVPSYGAKKMFKYTGFKEYDDTGDDSQKIKKLPERDPDDLDGESSSSDEELTEQEMAYFAQQIAPIRGGLRAPPLPLSGGGVGESLPLPGGEGVSEGSGTISRVD